MKTLPAGNLEKKSTNSSFTGFWNKISYCNMKQYINLQRLLTISCQNAYFRCLDLFPFCFHDVNSTNTVVAFWKRARGRQWYQWMKWSTDICKINFLMQNYGSTMVFSLHSYDEANYVMTLNSLHSPQMLHYNRTSLS